MADETEGRKIVIGFFMMAVVIVSVLGFLIGIANPDGLEKPKLLFFIELPKTPFGMALFGALSVGIFIFVLLGLVELASRYENRL
ncbi:MAG: cox cluster protein [Halobacteria archaeon]